ncbi:MAG: hypothetical protein D6723_12235 [Acidobacteria bacterium]|nr:MAG: hypothetical protein D6723_12235 [Acidobacteriota bacterium]
MSLWKQDARASVTLFALGVIFMGVLMNREVDRHLQVRNLRAFHRSGQTFLTFDEVEEPLAGEIKYAIYRSRRRIEKVSPAIKLAEVSPDSSYNLRASDPRVENRPVQLRVVEGEDVPAGRGLFVYTTPEDGAFYYAVTAIVDGVENTAVSESNSLSVPVKERVDWPEPIFQGMTLVDGIPTPRYVHFVNANETPLLPPMANTYETKDIHFNFLLRGVDLHATQPQPLVIGFHGGNGIFTEALQPTGHPHEILLGVDDPPPHTGYPPAVNTLWLGYAANLGTSEPLENGRVEPYTLRRIRYVVQWVERRFRVDRNRIYCAGTSFGAVGALMYGLAFPREIAALWLNMPRYDFRADGDEMIDDPRHPGEKISAWDLERGGAAPITARFHSIFGTRQQNLPTPEDRGMFRSMGDGLGVYDRINFRGLVSRNPGIDLPMMLMFHGKFDNVTGWHEKPLMVKALEEARQPFQFYFITSGHSFQPPDAFFATAFQRHRLYEYVVNQSLLAFQNASGNSDLGDGYDLIRCAQRGTSQRTDLGTTASFVQRCLEAPDGLLSGDRQGTINGYLDWSRHGIIDLSYRYEVTVFVAEAAPHAEIVADVTIRRLQKLRHEPGQKYLFENIDLASGQYVEPPRDVSADEWGRVVIPRVRIKKTGNRLRLRTKT